MNKAFRLMLCLCLGAIAWTQTLLRADAQVNKESITRVANDENILTIAALPRISTSDFSSLVFPTFHGEYLFPQLIFANDTAAMLQNAIAKRLGVRYRFYGVDDRGYDCSGFVWRVFQDAGADFDRVAARTLWRELPRATTEETVRFGTLVFFNGLRHVGIVRDAYSFYHASRSEGVTVSSFSGYWGRRVTGYRRAPIQLLPEPFRIGD